ncbi:tripartite tricarboxylate transporter substrate-binding protein [Bosea sp. 124]|uniref:tripartite tricarboxylate transporter substrate-binding protein n=1 Tax=Bosea sp. 124 TaxID=2135642 RepID=UPI000D3CEE27|nr:tripartite tricarboxylate transporter substrate-binding protein [Bosea sp. 124]PTM39769.1 tripartite-type tricarboxylate transporter receptor subunit TctC [Bosea sp. 124]
MLKIAVMAAALAAASASVAQDFPSAKPITIVVPFAAGGPGDTIARLLGVAMKSALNQNVIVENALGAGGTTGTARAARAAPDGYTVLLMHTGLATAPALYDKLPFSPTKDLAPIGLVTDVTMTLVGRPDYPAKNLQELVADLKARGDKVTFGHNGRGSAAHLCGVLFMDALGKPLTWVAYRGGSQVVNDLMSGQIDIYCDPATGTTPLIQADKIKAYAVTTKKRLKTLPNLPTADEAGLPGFEVSTWYGLYAPAGTPEPVIAKLTAALQTALADPVTIQRFSDLSMEPVTREQATPKALADFLGLELKKWSAVMAKAGVKPE